MHALWGNTGRNLMGARSRGDALLALQRQVTALTQQVNDLQWLVAESHRQQQLLFRECRETTVAAVRECMSQLPVLLERAMAQAVSSGQLGLPAEPASVDSGVPLTDARDAGRPRSPSPQPLSHGAPAHVSLMADGSAADADACRGSASAHVALTVNDAPLGTDACRWSATMTPERALAAGRPPTEEPREGAPAALLSSSPSSVAKGNRPDGTTCRVRGGPDISSAVTRDPGQTPPCGPPHLGPPMCRVLTAKPLLMPPPAGSTELQGPAVGNGGSAEEMCAQDSPPARGPPYSMPLDMDLSLPCGLPYPEPLSCCDILASPPPRPVSARQAADERPPPEPPPAAWVIKALAPVAAAVHARPPPVASAVSAATAAAAAAIATYAIDTLAAAPIPHLPPPMQPWALTHAQWNALMHALWGNTPRPPPPHGFGPCPYRASAESASGVADAPWCDVCGHFHHVGVKCAVCGHLGAYDPVRDGRVALRWPGGCDCHTQCWLARLRPSRIACSKRKAQAAQRLQAVFRKLRGGPEGTLPVPASPETPSLRHVALGVTKEPWWFTPSIPAVVPPRSHASTSLSVPPPLPALAPLPVPPPPQLQSAAAGVAFSTLPGPISPACGVCGRVHRKTHLCTYFIHLGHCQRGMCCDFAHGVLDMPRQAAERQLSRAKAACIDFVPLQVLVRAASPGHGAVAAAKFAPVFPAPALEPEPEPPPVLASERAPASAPAPQLALSPVCAALPSLTPRPAASLAAERAGRKTVCVTAERAGPATDAAKHTAAKRAAGPTREGLQPACPCAAVAARTSAEAAAEAAGAPFCGVCQHFHFQGVKCSVCGHLGHREASGMEASAGRRRLAEAADAEARRVRNAEYVERQTARDKSWRTRLAEEREERMQARCKRASETGESPEERAERRQAALAETWREVERRGREEAEAVARAAAERAAAEGAAAERAAAERAAADRATIERAATMRAADVRRVFAAELDARRARDEVTAGVRAERRRVAIDDMMRKILHGGVGEDEAAVRSAAERLTAEDVSDEGTDDRCAATECAVTNCAAAGFAAAEFSATECAATVCASAVCADAKCTVAECAVAERLAAECIAAECTAAESLAAGRAAAARASAIFPTHGCETAERSSETAPPVLAPLPRAVPERRCSAGTLRYRRLQGEAEAEVEVARRLLAEAEERCRHASSAAPAAELASPTGRAHVCTGVCPTPSARPAPGSPRSERHGRQLRRGQILDQRRWEAAAETRRARAARGRSGVSHSRQTPSAALVWDFVRAAGSNSDAARGRTKDAALEHGVPAAPKVHSSALSDAAAAQAANDAGSPQPLLSLVQPRPPSPPSLVIARPLTPRVFTFAPPTCSPACPGRPFTFGTTGAWGFRALAPSPAAAMDSLPPVPVAPPFADAAAERVADVRSTAERIAEKGHSTDRASAAHTGTERTAAERAAAEREEADSREAALARVTLAINMLERRAANEAADAAATLSAASTDGAACVTEGRIPTFGAGVAEGCARRRIRTVALHGIGPERGRRRPHVRMRDRRESFLIRCPSSALLQRRWRRDVGCA